jgi:hypothetical protein
MECSIQCDHVDRLRIHLRETVDRELDEELSDDDAATADHVLSPLREWQEADSPILWHHDPVLFSGSVPGYEHPTGQRLHEIPPAM